MQLKRTYKEVLIHFQCENSSLRLVNSTTSWNYRLHLKGPLLWEFLSVNFLFYLLCLAWCDTHVPWCVCVHVSQKTTWGAAFFFSFTIWLPGLELRLSSPESDPLSCEPFSWPPIYFYNMDLSHVANPVSMLNEHYHGYTILWHDSKNNSKQSQFLDLFL